jgi:hypothetical protein
MRYLVEQYYSIKPEEVDDPFTGKKSTDWDTFWRKRAGFLELMPDTMRTTFEDYLKRRQTPMEKLFNEVNSTYIRPYWDMRDAVLRALPADQQSIVRRYDRASNVADKNAIANITFTGIGSDGRTRQLSVIGNFNSAVEMARKSYRLQHPLTDFYLYRWGYVTTLLSPDAQSISNQNGMGIPGLESMTEWPRTMQDAIDKATRENMDKYGFSADWLKGGE